jgi:putative ABC transport system permease protein
MIPLTLKLSWRNVMRNRKRTVISAIAIGLGLAGIIFAASGSRGMAESLVRTTTDTFLGQAQIHYGNFLDSDDIAETIADREWVESNLEKENIVKNFSPRVISPAMVTSPANVSSALVYGIDIEKERAMSKIDEVIVDGEYLSDGNENTILVGRKLADLLSLKVGTRVVLTATQRGTNQLAQAMFKIGGIFSFNIRELDSNVVFVPIKKLQEMLSLGDDVHEIALDFTDIRMASDKNMPFWKKYSNNGNHAKSWAEIIPELKAGVDVFDFSVFVSAILIFAVVSLGVMNTLFMSLYERLFEFGVLRAVGFSQFRMALMVILESTILALLSIAVGIVFAYLANLIVGMVGIDYRGIEYAGTTYLEKIRPISKISDFTNYSAMLWVFTFVVSFYPAIYTARLNPIRAMRKGK